MHPVEFYATVCDCKNTNLECPGIVNSSATGWVPRGFFTEAIRSPVDLLAVCKNPGHPLSGEVELYRNRSGIEIATEHIEHARSSFKGDNDFLPNARRSTTFHKNLRRYLSYFLDVPLEDVFGHFAYTNLVKCSSVGERDRLNSKTIEQCFSLHFVREIAFFKPKVLLACGREIENFLVTASNRGLHSLPVVYVKHPSYFYKRENERETLGEIKAEIRSHLAA